MKLFINTDLYERQICGVANTVTLSTIVTRVRLANFGKSLNYVLAAEKYYHHKYHMFVVIKLPQSAETLCTKASWNFN